MNIQLLYLSPSVLPLILKDCIQVFDTYFSFQLILEPSHKTQLRELGNLYTNIYFYHFFYCKKTLFVILLKLIIKDPSEQKIDFDSEDIIRILYVPLNLDLNSSSKGPTLLFPLRFLFLICLEIISFCPSGVHS